MSNDVKVSGTLIEGVGDDLIGLFVMVLIAIASLVYTYW